MAPKVVEIWVKALKANGWTISSTEDSITIHPMAGALQSETVRPTTFTNVKELKDWTNEHKGFPWSSGRCDERSRMVGSFSLGGF